MRFVDRSRITTDWGCPRARWWGYEFGGRGVARATRAAYFDIGNAIHSARAALLAGESVDDVVPRILTEFHAGTASQGWEEWKQAEQGALVAGMIYAWARQVLPTLLAEYEVVAVEQEFPTEIAPGLTMGVKPDSLLERKLDKTLWYYECKTTSHLGPSWGAQWTKAVQLHGTAFLAGQRLSRPIEGMVIDGIYKGYVDKKSNTQKSILCYGHQRPGLLHGPEVSYVWRAGSKPAPTWEMPGGVQRWVANMPREVLSELFVQTPPIYLQERLVGAYLRQTVVREDVITSAHGDMLENPDAVEDIMDVVFPQHFASCAPAIGSPCAWSDCCFNSVVGADPVASGLYVWRDPHHAAEVVEEK
jgi:hypothetical protein